MENFYKTYICAAKPLRVGIGVLIILAIIFGLLDYYELRKNNGLRTEIGGSLITILFFDMIIKINEEKKEMKINGIVKKVLNKIIEKEIHILINQLKMCEFNKLKEDIDLNYFNEEVINKICNKLDISLPAPVPYGYDRRQYIFESCKETRSTIDKIIDKYGIYLNENLIDYLEEYHNLKYVQYHLGGEINPKIKYMNQERFISAYNEYVLYMKRLKTNNDQYLIVA